MKIAVWEMRKLTGKKLSFVFLALIAVVLIQFFFSFILLYSSGWQEKDMTSHMYNGLSAIQWEKEICRSFDGRIIDDNFVAEVNAVFENSFIAFDDVHTICSVFNKTDLTDLSYSDGGTVSGTTLQTNIPVREILGDTEYLYRYGSGWKLLINNMDIIGGVAAIAGIFMSAVVFSGEYASGTDALLLTSKYGKRKLAIAKYLVGLLLPVLIVALSVGVLALLIFSTFGFSGGDGSAALMFSNFHSSDRLIGGFTDADFSVTYAGAAFNSFITIIITAAICSAVAMIISAVVKSDIVSVALTAGILLLPSVIEAMIPRGVLIDHRWLRSVFAYIPVNAVTKASIQWFREKVYINGFEISYFFLLLPLCILTAVVSAVISTNRFSRHQVQ